MNKHGLHSWALSGKMLLVRIVENNEIDDYLGQVRLSKAKFCSAGLGNGLIGPPAGARKRKKNL